MKYALSSIDQFSNTIFVHCKSEVREDLRDTARLILEVEGGLWGEELSEKMTLLMDRPDKVMVMGRELVVMPENILNKFRDELGAKIVERNPGGAK